MSLKASKKTATSYNLKVKMNSFEFISWFNKMYLWLKKNADKEKLIETYNKRGKIRETHNNKNQEKRQILFPKICVISGRKKLQHNV